MNIKHIRHAKVEANLVLTAAYIFQREDIVPPEIKERIENALQQQVKIKIGAIF